MKIATRDFGELEINAQEVISFKQPIFGFERLHDYVLLYDDSVGNSIIWLQSVEDSKVCFVIIDPDALPHSYRPELAAETLSQLEIDDLSDLVVRVIAVIPDDFACATVNLKSPVIINIRLRCAAQVMLDGDYPIRAALVSSGEGRGQ